MYIVNKNNSCNSAPMGCFVTIFVLIVLMAVTVAVVVLLRGWGDGVSDNAEEE